MNAELFHDLAIQTTASLVGVFVGGLAALAADRYNALCRRRQRARSLLRALTQELNDNYETLRGAKGAYEKTAWGKSFYVSTTAWEAALSDGELADTLGHELADRLTRQYGWLVRIRYSVDLMTQLWFAPRGGAYDEMQRGFRQAILTSMERALQGHVELARHLRKTRPEG